MKRKRTFYVFLFTLSLFFLSPVFLIGFQDSCSIRVACVGDSITYGAKIENRFLNSYPSRLQQLLGGKYLVKNFGASGCTLQKNSNFSYWDHRNFEKSSDFEPDYVLIMLGTNDTKPYYWNGTEHFLKDYRDLISHYRSLESNPQIILMTPATVYPENFPAVRPYYIQSDIADTIADAVIHLGEEEQLPVIDIHRATAFHPDYFSLDGVHPSASGAAEIASLAYETIKNLEKRE